MKLYVYNILSPWNVSFVGTMTAKNKDDALILMRAHFLEKYPAEPLKLNVWLVKSWRLAEGYHLGAGWLNGGPE